MASLQRLAMGASALSLVLLVACASDTPPAMPTAQPWSGAAAASFSGTDTNLTPAQLETLVGPVALYPDDLLALVLPASTQPLQVVDAQRFLQQRKTNPGMQPPKTWDPSVIALLNYPEALARMTADLTWLQQFGTSVANQQAGVMDAVQAFRKKALDAGNLKSNDKQTVSAQTGEGNTSQTIVIESANPQVIYVPTYEPATVVYAPPPGYYPYYWSAPYPYYYYPAAPFYMGTYVGVAIGFGCDWDDHDVYHGDINVDNININRDQIRERVENRQNSNLANQIRRNPENVWRPDQTGLSQARASGEFSSRSSLQRSGDAGSGLGAGAADGARAAALDGRAPGDASRSGRLDLSDPGPRSDLGGDRSSRASSSGAFSGIDRGVAASRYSARGAGSMGGGFRGGGGRGGRR